MDQWNNSLRKKEKKSLISNFTCVKHIKYKNYEMANKNNSSEYVVFNWPINFSEKEYFLQCTNKNISQIFLLMVCTNSNPNYASFVLLYTKFPSSNNCFWNIPTNYFCTPLIKGKTGNK